MVSPGQSKPEYRIFVCPACERQLDHGEDSDNYCYYHDGVTYTGVEVPVERGEWPDLKPEAKRQAVEHWEREERRAEAYVESSTYHEDELKEARRRKRAAKRGEL